MASPTENKSDEPVQGPSNIDECNLCGEKGELSFFDFPGCTCLFPYACQDCYDRLYAHHFVDPNVVLRCPFCMQDIQDNSDIALSPIPPTTPVELISEIDTDTIRSPYQSPESIWARQIQDLSVNVQGERKRKREISPKYSCKRRLF